MNKYRDIMGRLNYALFLTVVALLPFPQLFLRYACVAWIIAWVLELRWLEISNIKFQLSNSKFTIPFLLFGLWFIGHVISGLWAPDHSAWGTQIERYISFGALIPVGIWGVNERYDWRQVGKVLIVSCLCAIVFYPTLLTFLFYHRAFIDVHQWTAPLWDYSSQEWWSFYSTNLSHIKHNLFLCLIMYVAALIAVELYRGRWLLLVPIETLLFSFSLLTGSRQALLTGMVLLIGIVLTELPHRIRRYSIGIVLVGIVTGISLLAVHPRMQKERLHQEPRMKIWRFALEHPQDYLTHGLGGGQSTDYLIHKYEENNAFFYIMVRYHSHNQYLEELMELGIGGLLIFLLAWMSIPLCASGSGRKTAWLFSIMMMLCMLTECIFAVFCGVALWAVSMILIRLQSDGKRQE